MRIIRLLLVLILVSNIIYSQGIRFEQGVSWYQLKEKAKSENKYIFVDCYATWCAPCKFMDKMVYPTKKAGAAMNDEFLSLKIQFDSTENDDDEIKRWHQTAHELGQQFKIVGFPTYLFFSPQGKLVYKTVGIKSADDFVKMVNYAMTNPIQRGSKLMDEYKRGIKDYFRLPELIEIANEAGEKELAAIIIEDYKANYLNKLIEDSLLTKERIGFLFNHYNLVTSKDSFFKLTYSQPSKIDSIWGEAVAQTFVNYTIRKEEIDDKIWKNSTPITMKPNWQKLEASIRRKYGKVDAKQMIAEARSDFYKKSGNWKEFARIKDKEINDHPPKAMPEVGFLERLSWRLNEHAWDVFKLCTDKEILRRALNWSELSIKLAYEESPKEHPLQHLDTKANLLYKLGRAKEAIALEQKILELSTNGGNQKGSDQFKNIIDKMKKGEPTWDVK